MKKIINYLNETIKKERALLTFVLIIFILGIVIGSLFINFVTEADKNLLVSQVETFFSSIKKLGTDVFGIKVFSSGVLNNFLQLTIIFVLGVSMVGIPAVILILFFKGFMLGTTLSTIILKYQVKGVLGCFLYVFPVMIVNVIIYVFFSFFAVYVSLRFLKALFKKDNLNFKAFLGKYLLAFLLSLVLMAITCLFDSFLTPLLLKLFTFMI
ncbi:MAG: stage II sporulation protein M [Bacilli bacterium]|nr:stage II sporulation protein M [Bacilli bacterium]